MKRRKRGGPSVDPCGMPHLIVNETDLMSPICTY